MKSMNFAFVIDARADDLGARGGARRQVEPVDGELEGRRGGEAVGGGGRQEHLWCDEF